MAPPQYKNMTLSQVTRKIKEDWLGDAYRAELLPLAIAVFDTRNPVAIHAHLSRENHVRIIHELWAFHPADYFGRIECPTLIVNAVHPATALTAEKQTLMQQAADQIKQSEVVWMSDTLHDIPWHRPNDLNLLLRKFLKIEN